MFQVTFRQCIQEASHCDPYEVLYFKQLNENSAGLRTRVRPETQKYGVCTNVHAGAVPLLRRLVTGFPQQQLGSIPGHVIWDLWWKKRH
jgi:hypothetical protein